MKVNVRIGVSTVAATVVKENKKTLLVEVKHPKYGNNHVIKRHKAKHVVV